MAAIQSESTDAPGFYITIPPVSIVQDTALMAHIVQLINEAYTIAEAGIFDDKYRRTNAEEVTKFVTAGQLALASNSTASPWSPADNVQGCIRIIKLSDAEGELAMLSAAASARGTGLGKQLMAFGEEHCRACGAQRARLDLLVPTTFVHKTKTWVQAWYERLGYRVVGLTDFGKTYPWLVPTLITEVEYRQFVKEL